jgi:hypothetical protein
MFGMNGMSEYKQFDDSMTRMTAIIVSVGLAVLMLGAIAKAGSSHRRLFNAIYAVENPRNVRCRHAAQGPLQIQPALVRGLREIVRRSNRRAGGANLEPGPGRHVERRRRPLLETSPKASPKRLEPCCGSP